MLLPKAPGVNDVASIKLLNNDEVVARITETTTDTVTVEKVVLLAISMDPSSGRPGINMLPFWMMGSDPSAKITLQRSHILALLPASKDMKDSWTQMMTGLVMPSSGSGLVV